MIHKLAIYHNARTNQWRGRFPHLKDEYCTTGDHADSFAVINEAGEMLELALTAYKENGIEVPECNLPEYGDRTLDGDPEFIWTKTATLIAPWQQ